MISADEEHRGMHAAAVGWVLHSLEPDEEARFVGHAAGCVECRKLVDDATATMGEVAMAMQDSEPSDGLRERILGAAIDTPQDHGRRDHDTAGSGAESAPHNVSRLTDGSGRRRDGVHAAPGRHGVLRRQMGRQAPLLVAAAVLLVAVIGLSVWVGLLRSDRESSRSTAQRYERAVSALTVPGTRDVSLRTPKGATAATVVTGGSDVRIVSMSLSANNTKISTYVLWGLPSGGAPTALGTFDVTGTQVGVSDVHVLRGPQGFPKYAVSREPGRSAPASPSTVLASGKAV